MRGQGITIEMSVDKLITILEKNRNKHERDYVKAKAGWEKLLKKELLEKLAALENGGKLELAIKNQKPMSFLHEYDEVITMLKAADNVTAELDQEQFACYIKDEWTWKAHWTSSNTTYISNARRR